MKKIIEKLSEKRNEIFLIMCLMVHIFNVVLFYSLGSMPLCKLNIGSSLFYIIILSLYKKTKDYLIVFTYLEILTFSLLSELFGGRFMYICFIIGMVAVVFYLLPSRKKHKHFYQLLGILIACSIYQINVIDYSIFPEVLEMARKYRNPMGYLSLGITVFTLFYISNLYLIDLNLTKEKLDYNSNHDALTGLFNRRFFEHIIHRHNVECSNPYSIAMFDVDNFKKINDTYSHAAGDLVLETLSKIMSENVRPDDLAVRWGGEEFILYMPNTSIENAYLIVKKICDEIRSCTIDFNEYSINITVTVGLSFGNDVKDYENVIASADQKLYEGKRTGKNKIVM